MTYEENKKDLDTKMIRPDLKLELTDKQYIHLCRYAYQSGFINPADLVTSFVADLTGWHRNGSDEAMYIGQWYDRAFYPYGQKKFFVYYLYNNNYSISEIKTMAGFYDDDDNGIEEFENCYEAYKDEYIGEEIETPEECKECLKKIISMGNWNYSDTDDVTRTIKKHEEFFENNPDIEIVKTNTRYMLIKYIKSEGEYEIIKSIRNSKELENFIMEENKK